MNTKLKVVIGILAFAVLIAAAYFAYNKLTEIYKPDSDISGTQKQDERVKAPDFTVKDINGEDVKLSDFAGKPIVLNFWASWCPPCKAEMPYFNKVYNEIGDSVTFIMVDLVDGQRETVDTGKKYVDEQKYNFPVYFDTKQDAAYTYGIQSIPTTFFIDSEGYIVKGKKGGMEEKELRAYLSYIAGEK